MRNSIPLYICLLLFSCGTRQLLYGQEKSIRTFRPNPTERVDTADYRDLRMKIKPDSAHAARYAKVVQSFECPGNVQKPGTSIVFTGSSTIALWDKKLYSDMSPLPVIRRGISGSGMTDLIYYFERMIKPVQPKVAVLYCENDIGSGTNHIYELFRYYEYLYHSEFPNSVLYIVSLKPSVARKHLIPQVKEINSLLKEYAEIRPYTEYINIFDAMVPNGVLDESLFRLDGLHLNDKGYSLWSTIIKPVITK